MKIVTFAIADASLLDEMHFRCIEAYFRKGQIMYRIQTPQTGQTYLTLCGIGWITIFTAYALALAYNRGIVSALPTFKRSVPIGPINILLAQPLSYQIMLCFLYLAGLVAMIQFCRWRKASPILSLAGMLPLLLAFLYYALAQCLVDLRWDYLPSWSYIYLNIGALLFVLVALLMSSSLFFILSSGALLNQLITQRRNAF